MKNVKRKLFALAMSFVLIFVATPALAAPITQNLQEPTVVEDQLNQITSSEISQAGSETIIPLGRAFDKDRGKFVEGYAIVHYKKNAAHSSNTGRNNGSSSCYGFLAKGAKWKVTESYTVASNIDPTATARNLEKWDSQVAFEVFGNQDSLSVVDGVDTIAPDNKNEIMFGPISQEGAIAITYVWGFFGGLVSQRELVEFDLVFDNVDFNWGDATVDPTVMDFENIATHELGHAAGLKDLYDSSCAEQTMYGYAATGETKKRTLEAGDITGIKKLYN